MKVIPTLPDAETLAREIERPCLIPFGVTEEDLENPAKVYSDLREKYDSSFLLESIEGSGYGSGYSDTGCDPLLQLESRGGSFEVKGYSEVARVSQERADAANEDADELEILKKAAFMDEIHVFGLNLPRYPAVLFGKQPGQHLCYVQNCSTKL